MKRIVDALKYAVLGGKSQVGGNTRAMFIERGLRVMQLFDRRNDSEAEREAYDQALAQLHLLCTPQAIIALAAGLYLPAIGPTPVGAWVHHLAGDLKVLVRRLSHEYAQIDDQLAFQREAIRRAHLAALDAGAFGKVERSPDIRDGIANLVRHLAGERDQLREELGASIERELAFRRLATERGAALDAQNGDATASAGVAVQPDAEHAEQSA